MRCIGVLIVLLYRLAQRYLFHECDLLQRIMSHVVQLESNGQMRAPVIGHLIQIAITITSTCSPAPPSVDSLSIDSPVINVKSEERYVPQIIARPMC